MLVFVLAVLTASGLGNGSQTEVNGDGSKIEGVKEQVSKPEHLPSMKTRRDQTILTLRTRVVFKGIPLQYKL